MSVDLSWNDAGTVATVCLNRPEALNAMNYEALTGVASAFQQADAAGARIIVLRGAGRSFCAGADRKQYPGFSTAETDEGLAQHAIEIGASVKRALSGTNALTIAQLHGHVVGGGLVMAMCCDMRFVAEDASLSLPELKLALPLGWGALYRLIELVGTTRAWSMLAEFEVLSGLDAVKAGLCSSAFAPEALAAAVAQRVEALMEIDPEALFLTKRQFRAIAGRASFGNLDDIDGALLLGPLRGLNVRQKFTGL
ncbi:enoyl-CoA hydratase/isomerase family protein [Devosia limi]|uniref:Enoyl-CoA hydratase/carnithine racemase n=1 Tax=Devosia limi DSM 17137 TaxID=1121477 RepID=A0A1M5CZU1_9HYPH|nr:enoyl-CoA hydratase/isomerase family protein [Devosia limi]SHF60032.1 Enoyl-CoA hydratase/carnithine racemase [Devosia limi DSM 17137]